MTTTLPSVRSAPATRTVAADLLSLLEETLAVVAEDDELDRFSTRTPAGAALTSLSAVTRRAAAALGADAGPALTEGRGVVVVRDLVTATRVLARAADRLGGAVDGADLGGSLDAARGVSATFRQLLTAAR